MGPNEGKTFLQRTNCVVRALMALRPTRYPNPGEEEQIIQDYESKNGSLQGKWVKHIRSWGDFYIYRGDPISEGGRSCQTLPAGAEVAATFDLRATENGIIRRLEKDVSYLESQSTYETQNLGYNINVKDEVLKFKRVLNACDPNYNKGQIIRFQNWLMNQPDTIEMSSQPKAISFNFLKMREFCDYLVKQRSEYLADADLFGSAITIWNICNLCSQKAKQDVTAAQSDSELAYTITFLNLANVFVLNQVNPEVLLDMTTYKAIQLGFVDVLVDIVMNYREVVDDDICKALDAETTDGAFDRLYSALPYSNSAKIILTRLKMHPDKTESKAKLIEGSFETIDETQTILSHAIHNQLMDFYGEDWKNFKKKVAWRRQEYGDANAKEYVDYIVERSLFYPRRFKTELLDQTP
jgi:hypothetical protein